MLTLKDLKIDGLLTEKKRDGKFVTIGVNWVWSLDGHDKLVQGLYDREDENDRKILAYVFIPIDIFVELWNNSRTRFQRNTLMPDGIPNVIYDSPEEYNLEDKGWHLSRQELAEAAEASGILDVSDDYVDEAFRAECARHLPDVESVQAKDAARKYRELRNIMKE